MIANQCRWTAACGPRSRWAMGLRPFAGNELLKLGSGRGGDSREHVLQVVQRVDPMQATAGHEAVQDRRSIPRLGMPDEEPVLLLMRSSA